jgi:pyridoxal phosphate enzyme (YggS family)
MIGHVQSRKARGVAINFDWVHSLDSVKLAQRFERFLDEAGRRIPVLLECNVSAEESKSGFQAWREEDWPKLLPDLEVVAACEHLEMRGLMTMAPYLEDPEKTRPYFKRLKRLQGFFAAQLPQTNWSELSMGMSDDFEIAIQEGATIVRIGTAILGPRPVRGKNVIVTAEGSSKQ